MTASSEPSGIADLEPIARRREQRSWYFYDWANSAFSTTVAGVLFGPYLIAIAEEAGVDNRISVQVTIDRKGSDGMTLIEVAPGTTLDEIKSKTEASYRVTAKPS